MLRLNLYGDILPIVLIWFRALNRIRYHAVVCFVAFVLRKISELG